MPHNSSFFNNRRVQAINLIKKKLAFYKPGLYNINPMRKREQRNILVVLIVVFLLIIVLFIGILYVFSLKENGSLSFTLRQMEKQMLALEKEKQNLLREIEKEKALESLSQDNSGAVTAAGAANQMQALAEDKLAQLGADFDQAQKIIAELVSRVSTLKAENTLLTEEKIQLNSKLVEVTQENSMLKERMNSIAELKRAIRELKIRMHQERVEARRRIEIKKVMEGNRGYLVKDGKSVSSGKVKIEVTPAQ
jgi:uncharacterized protein (DUF3084 family)